METVLLAFFGVSLGFGYFLISHDRGPREPVKAILQALVIGVASAVVAMFAELLLLPNFSVDSALSLPVAIGVGAIEELLKFLPLAWIIYRKPYFNELNDGPIYFGICGLGFGLLENVGYTLSYGTGAGIERLVLLPFFHAATCGIIGYYLARRKAGLDSEGNVVRAALGMVLVHGAYDYLIGSGIVVQVLLGALLTLLLSISFFRLYRRAGIEDAKLGQGGSAGSVNGPLPPELKHWNWAAFLMNWLWSIFHDSWLGLLVPVLFLTALLLHGSGSLGRSLEPFALAAILPILLTLGLKGSGMAWRNRSFASIEQFLTIERIWTRWGIGFALLGGLAWLAS